MKKDDNLIKKVENSLKSIGYKNKLPIEVRPASEWLEKNFPKSTIRENSTHLFREDLYKEAYKKYPSNGWDDDYFYERRNYMVKLAIDEIKSGKKTSVLEIIGKQQKQIWKDILKEISDDGLNVNNASVLITHLQKNYILNKSIIINK